MGGKSGKVLFVFSNNTHSTQEPNGAGSNMTNVSATAGTTNTAIAPMTAMATRPAAFHVSLTILSGRIVL